MIEVGLVDYCFSNQNAMGLYQENQWEAPKLMRWKREVEGVGNVVLTDQRLKEFGDYQGVERFALLIEPYALRPNHYEFATLHQDQFKAILTFDRRFIDNGKFIYYPFGGSYIRDWAMFPKVKRLSIVTSKKKTTPGHLLRHQVVQELGPVMEVFGEPYRDFFTSKADPLRPFMFSIVIESEKADWYFTEKLIDCFSQGTIPIYWGCPDIGRFFNTRGMFQFDDMAGLRRILDEITQQTYLERLPAIRDNLERARSYRIAEDWIVQSYPGLFQ